MSWRVAVEHRTRYRYDGPVWSSYNEARLTPLTTDAQLVLDSTVTIEPGTRPSRYLDYWGSVVHVFDLQIPHTELVVTARSLVETAAPVAAIGGLGWEDLGSARVRDEQAELLAPTSMVPSDPRLEEVAAALRQGRDPAAAARAAIEWVRGQLRYVTGSTGVHTSAVQAWEGGSGVCQDFAHLALAVLRAAGIPSRYCSGYLHPNADASIGEAVDAESHAWIEWWTGDWHAADPTIGYPAGERHVLVARGRDYADVAPLKGVVHGGPTAALEVGVTVTRLA